MPVAIEYTYSQSPPKPSALTTIQFPPLSSELDHDLAHNLPFKEGYADAAEQKVRVRFLKSYRVPNK